MAEIRQRIVVCPHGHCYDANKYAACPICNKAAATSMSSSGSLPQIQDPYSSGGGQVGSFSQTQDPYSSGGGQSGSFPRTQDPYSSGGGQSGSFPRTQDPYSSGGGQVGSFPQTQDPYFSGGGQGGSFPRTQDSYSGGSQSGVTMPPRYSPYPAYQSKTDHHEKMSKTCFVDPSTPPNTPVPVVGWLVAVAGPCRGTDYRIHNGYNYIGREEGDICIHGDSTISAVKDANVTYVPQTRSFYIAHELGKNVLLVNDVPVIGGAQKLNSYDIVTLGKTRLLFIPMCGENFSWDDEV